MECIASEIKGKIDLNGNGYTNGSYKNEAGHHKDDDL